MLLCLESGDRVGRLMEQSPGRWRSMMRETRDKHSSFLWLPKAVQGRFMVMVFLEGVVAVQGILVEDWMVHGGRALLRGSVHRGCVVCGRIADQIVGDSALQRGGHP